jgi:hypothetical protein
MLLRDFAEKREVHLALIIFVENFLFSSFVSNVRVPAISKKERLLHNTARTITELLNTHYFILSFRSALF